MRTITRNGVNVLCKTTELVKINALIWLYNSNVEKQSNTGTSMISQNDILNAQYLLKTPSYGRSLRPVRNAKVILVDHVNYVMIWQRKTRFPFLLRHWHIFRLDPTDYTSHMGGCKSFCLYHLERMTHRRHSCRFALPGSYIHL